MKEILKITHVLPSLALTWCSIKDECYRNLDNVQEYWEHCLDEMITRGVMSRPHDAVARFLMMFSLLRLPGPVYKIAQASFEGT